MKFLRSGQGLLRALGVVFLILVGQFSAAAETLSTSGSVPWIFSNGPEFPGATGSLSYSSGAVKLAFDITNGGNYVSATHWIKTPVAADALELRVKSPGGVHLQFRVFDSSGQTLQYSPNRPFEASNAHGWYQMALNFGPTTAHWGGKYNDGVLHGSVIGISVMAQPSLDKTGAIEFERVSVGSSLSTVVDPDEDAVTPPAVPDFAASMGVEITHADATREGLDLVQSLGFRRVRTEMFWADVETSPGVYDFSWYDALVAELAARGILPHFILCYGNPVFTHTAWFDPPLTSSAMEAFGKFAQAAAARYGRKGAHFEVWNEPDIATFWNPPSATEYSALCTVATEAVHTGNSDAPAASGGLAGVDLDFLEETIADGGVNGVNAIGLHPYRLQIPEQLSGDLVEMRARISGAFARDTPPVWSTEAGYSSAWYGNGSSAANRTTQAKWTVRQMLTGLALNFPEQIVFCLRDDGTDVFDSQDNFGILTSDYGTKPLTEGVRTLLGQCKERSFAGILASPEVTTHILKFQGASDTLLVLWSEDPDGAQTLSFPDKPSQVLDYLGQALRPAVDGAGRYTLSVSDSPVYVVFPGK